MSLEKTKHSHSSTIDKITILCDDPFRFKLYELLDNSKSNDVPILKTIFDNRVNANFVLKFNKPFRTRNEYEMSLRLNSADNSNNYIKYFCFFECVVNIENTVESVNNYANYNIFFIGYIL